MAEEAGMCGRERTGTGTLGSTALRGGGRTLFAGVRGPGQCSSAPKSNARARNPVPVAVS
eukprot:3931918-Rhodomonas_salina.1